MKEDLEFSNRISTKWSTWQWKFQLEQTKTKIQLNFNFSNDFFLFWFDFIITGSGRNKQLIKRTENKQNERETEIWALQLKS